MVNARLRSSESNHNEDDTLTSLARRAGNVCKRIVDTTPRHLS